MRELGESSQAIGSKLFKFGFDSVGLGRVGLGMCVRVFGVLGTGCQFGELLFELGRNDY